MISLELQAIKAALNRSWEEAVEYNLAILQVQPDDIEALNRLARAYTEIGQGKSAQTTYKKVLRLDRYNTIAKKNLDKLTSSPLPSGSASPPPQPQLFLEEPGKTKSVNLIKVTEAKFINHLTPGDEVCLTPKTRTIAITTKSNHYLGCLPDDLSHRLLKLLRLGNKYTALVRGVGKNSLSIIIRETARSKRASGPSFPLPQSSTFNQ